MWRLHLCICAFISILVLSAGDAQAQTTTNTANHKGAIALQGKASAAAPPAVGSGTAGQLTKWVGTDGSTFTIGDSIITESKLGLIGIGTTTPTSKLTVQGMVETKNGGFKFPDGTIQTTAGIGSIFHDLTLLGNGTSGLPLKVAVPLVLSGPAATLEATLTAFSVGSDPTYGQGGTAITGVGGNSPNFGGIGVIGAGGEANGAPGFGGAGLFGIGGRGAGTGKGGPGVDARGGGGTPGDHGGDGVTAQGGIDSGIGVSATGGFGNQSNGGIGVRAQGGNGGGFSPRFEGGIGIWARGGSGVSPGLAGKFEGDVSVTGTLSKGAGSFKIDHPLDPENKYLYHSFVESPDMMNIYNGNVTTDENGDAVITLPDWFETLNKDFRYQLTVIGTFAQAIVGSEMKDNHFAIKTSTANVKVSWQVTGIRQDPFAKAHRISVEEDKPETERGYYLHPELFNQPEEKSIEWARRPQLMQGLKDQRELIKRDSQKGNRPNQ